MIKRLVSKVLTLVMILSLLCAGLILLQNAADSWRIRQTQREAKALYGNQAAWLFSTAYAEEVFLDDDFNGTEEWIWEEDNADEDALIPEGETPVIPGTVMLPEYTESDDWAELSDEPFPEPQPDFAELLAANPDIAGWLKAGERIDSPVVLRDNEFYLDHNVFGRKDANGALFLNQINRIWPKDQILLIHGHALRTGDLFGELRRFKDEAYVRMHPLVEFRTIYEEAATVYIPIAGFDASVSETDRWFFNVLRTEFENEEDAGTYLTEMTARSYWQTPLDVIPEDKLLVLVTCSYLQTNGRFMLFCRALRKDETPDLVRSRLFNEPWGAIGTSDNR